MECFVRSGAFCGPSCMAYRGESEDCPDCLVLRFMESSIENAGNESSFMRVFTGIMTHNRGIPASPPPPEVR